MQVNKGLNKMYSAEVLDKFPIIQVRIALSPLLTFFFLPGSIKLPSL